MTKIGIGRENRVTRYDKIGCTIGGDGKVVSQLWEIGKKEPRLQFKYELFSATVP